MNREDDFYMEYKSMKAHQLDDLNEDKKEVENEKI